MKHLPPWLFYHLAIKVDLRLSWWRKGFVIWLGTEIQVGDSYGHKWNGWEVDLTVCNVGLKLIATPRTPLIPSGDILNRSQSTGCLRGSTAQKSAERVQSVGLFL